MQLTDDHIAYIVKDLHYRGIVAEGIQEELLDHVCTATEKNMAAGMRFIDAYQSVLKTFGNTAGLRQTQQRTIQSENQTRKNMIRNYFTIALRNLRKHSFYSFVNIAGLSTGVAICFIILLFVLNELSYDRHFTNADRIYRMKSEIKFAGNHWKMIYAPAPMAATLASDYPEVEAAVRFRERGSYLVKRTTENFKEDNVMWTDKDFFRLFDIPVIAGNAETALAEPNTIAISERIAQKYFPNENALGQTLTMDNRTEVKVTAVFKDLPANTHFHFNILISLAGLDEAKSPVWLSNNFQTYLLLREGASPRDLEKKFPNLVMTHMMPQIRDVFGADFTMEKFNEAGNMIEYQVQPLTDVHLKSSLQGEFEANFDITYLYMFIAIAAFILLIACINFMNLSTARSANRAKEVGVRKVMGSFRSHLMRQFLTESTMLSALSFVLAVGIAYLLLPYFNELSDRQLFIPFSQPILYAMLFGAALFVGLLAGIYPSFFLSAFKPIQVLKGNMALGMKSGFVRSALVVFQFTISIFLVIGTLAVNQQLNYIQNKKLGFNKDQVISIEDVYALGDKRTTFKDEIMRTGKMESATFSGFLPVTGGWRSDSPWWAEGKDPSNQENMVSIQNWRVDYNYIKTMGMSIKEGRDFSEEFPSDSSAVLINEAAAKGFNFTGEIIGSKIATFGDNGDGAPDKTKLDVLTVVGIVENFHFESLKQNVSPVMIYLSKRPEGSLSFRFQSQNAQEVIQLIESKWKEMARGQPFSYSFLDERFGRMYASETRLGKVFGVFASIAIVVACLGLFALTSFTAEQRTKEIGIRKVLGASIGSIVMLLSKEFGKLILISFTLSAPLAWFGIDWWLRDYTFKTEIGVGLFLLAGFAAFAIAWLTMSYQSFKAAASDPVKSLRSE